MLDRKRRSEQKEREEPQRFVRGEIAVKRGLVFRSEERKPRVRTQRAPESLLLRNIRDSYRFWKTIRNTIKCQRHGVAEMANSFANSFA